MKQVRYTQEPKRWALEQTQSPLNRPVAEVAKAVDIKVVAANYSMLKRLIQPARSAPSLFAG